MVVFAEKIDIGKKITQKKIREIPKSQKTLYVKVKLFLSNIFIVTLLV